MAIGGGKCHAGGKRSMGYIQESSSRSAMQSTVEWAAQDDLSSRVLSSSMQGSMGAR